MSTLPPPARARPTAIPSSRTQVDRGLGAHLTLRNAALLLALCALWALAWFSLQTANRFARNGASVENALAIRDNLALLGSRVEITENARRGFVATGDQRFLTTYGNYRREANEALSTLPSLVLDPVQKEKLADLALKVGEALEAIDRSVELRKGREFSAEEQRAAGERIRSAIDQGRSVSQGMQVFEQKALHQYHDDTQSGADRYRYILLGATAGTFLLLLYSFGQYSAALQRRQKIEKALVAGQRQAELAVFQLTLLAEMGKLLQSCKDPSDVFGLVSQYGARLMVGTGGLYLMRESRKQLDLRASWGTRPGIEETFERDDCLALRHGEPHYSAVGATLTCRHVRARPGVSSECLPIIAHGEVLGTLCVENSASQGPQRSDQRLAVNFACQIGLALANMNLRDTLQSLSVRDPLTGLYNRRHMEESLSREVSIAQRKKRTLALAMLDLDHFKFFNDTFGHDAGDLLLKEVAKVLQRFVRGGDVTSRYGGEEFVLMCPETSLATMAERVAGLGARLQEFVPPLEEEFHCESPLTVASGRF